MANTAMAVSLFIRLLMQYNILQTPLTATVTILGHHLLIISFSSPSSASFGHRLRNRDWKRPLNLLAVSVSPARAHLQSFLAHSHPDAFAMLSGTSAVLSNVLTPSREVWRAKSTPSSPVARSRLFNHPVLGRILPLTDAFPTYFVHSPAFAD